MRSAGRLFIWIAIFGFIRPGAAAAMDRDQSLINSFQVLCTLQKPSFSAIEAKALAMKLPVHRDIEKGGGRVKSWFVSLTDGPHELLAAEAMGPKGHVVSCGISAPDPEGSSLRLELSREIKLGTPDSDTVTPDGVMRIIVWKNIYGLNTQLELVDAEPASKPGVMLYDVSIEPSGQ